MPHEIPGFDDKIFLESIALVPQRFTESTVLASDAAFLGLRNEHINSGGDSFRPPFPPPWEPPLQIGSLSDAARFRINSVLAGTYVTGSIFSPVSLPAPTTWDELITTYRKNSIDPIVNTPTIPNPDPKSGAAFFGFVQQYRDILGIGGSATAQDSPEGDWSVIGSISTPGGAITAPIAAQDVEDQFVNAFDHFMKGKSFDNIAELLDQWYAFLTVSSVLQSGTVIGGVGDLASYELVFTAFGFDPADFPNRLREFYEKKLSETGGGVSIKGFFIPSLHYDEWIEEIHDEFLVATGATKLAPGELTSVGNEFTKKLLSIDRILKLLILMIDVLNDVSATQAERLIILANWQKEYTDKLQQMPTFGPVDSNRTDLNPIFYRVKTGKDDTVGETIQGFRGDLNAEAQELITRIRGNRSVIQDDSKALRTNINQSQDAANQQANIATTLIQQLSTLLSAIFR